MVISTRAILALIIYSLKQTLYLELVNTRHRSRPVRVQKEMKQRINESKRKGHTKNEKDNTNKRNLLIALITAIMEISTLNTSAVKICPARRTHYVDVKSICHQSRLTRLQKETKKHPIESSQNDRTKTKKGIAYQMSPLIAVITAIMEISMRDGFSVNHSTKNGTIPKYGLRGRPDPEALRHRQCQQENRESTHEAIGSRLSVVYRIIRNVLVEDIWGNGNRANVMSMSTLIIRTQRENSYMDRTAATRVKTKMINGRETK